MSIVEPVRIPHTEEIAFATRQLEISPRLAATTQKGLSRRPLQPDCGVGAFVVLMDAGHALSRIDHPGTQYPRLCYQPAVVVHPTDRERRDLRPQLLRENEIVDTQVRVKAPELVHTLPELRLPTRPFKVDGLLDIQIPTLAKNEEGPGPSDRFDGREEGSPRARSPATQTSSRRASNRSPNPRWIHSA